MPLTKATTNVVDLNQPTVIDNVTISSGAGTGVENVGVGGATLESNTTGAYNVAVGHAALQFNTTGGSNIGIGRVAVRFNTTGNSNIGIGGFSLYGNNGDSNIAVGVNSMLGNTTGQQNVAVGNVSLSANSTGQKNTAIGHAAMFAANTTGGENTAVGWNAMAGSTGNENTGVGVYTLYANTGLGSTAVGRAALISNTTGSNNTAIGRAALFNNTIGTTNTALGESALNANVSFDNTTGLGYSAAVTGSNQVQLGNSATTTYAYGAVQNRSDIRDKADVRDTELGLDFVNALRPVDFKWDMREDYLKEAPKLVAKPVEPKEDASAEEKAKYAEELAAYNAYKIELDKWLEDSKLANITHDGSKKRNRFHHGLIAQEVKSVLDAKGIDFGGFQDHSVKGGDDVLSIGYIELIAPLIKAVQELSAKVAELESK